MEKYRYVFVVLLYRNMEDIIDLIHSIQNKLTSQAHVILVNSYYDESTLKQARNTAAEYGCSIINTENKGYGHGNNEGVKYALDHFEFDYLIICNPDTTIRYFDTKALLKPEVPAIYAPKIVASTGKLQNPHWAFHSSILEYLQYVGDKHKWKVLDYFVIAVLKAARILTAKDADKRNRKQVKVSSAHGSFVIVSAEATKKLYPFYDEHMFLFYEEVYLGNKAYLAKVPTYYVKDIVIDHKEDGSMRISNVNLRKESHKSVVYYYEHKGKGYK